MITSRAKPRLVIVSMTQAVRSMVLAIALVGCEQSESIRVVPIAGCGLDQTFSGLRVRVLGDYPPTSATELLLGNGEHGEVDRLPADATGIAAEGVFGMTVTAIGRSYGIDPALARGRIAGQSGPQLAIWFAAPDSMCPVSTAITTRAEFAWAEGPSGDVLIVGGRDASGLREDLIHYDVLANSARSQVGGSASARVGHSVHALAGRRFVVLGGARASAVLDDALFISEVVDPSADQAQLESVALANSLAHHAAAESGLGRILIAGGCDQVDALGDCVANVHARAAWIELGPDDTVIQTPLPELESARARAHAFVARDGVAFVAGGVDEAGVGLASVERLGPESAGWETIVEFDELGVDQLVGLTVLDGELVIVADTDGALHWWSHGGSGTLAPGSRAPMLASALGPRPLLGLPGERVLVDTWLFAPGSAAVDPSTEIVDLTTMIGGESSVARTGAAVVLLGDGSVLLGGGTPTGPGDLPFLARVRPQLDGPDEQVPELASPRSDAFVANTPGAATVIVGGLRLTGVAGSPDELPRVHVHVRGFRSRSFRLEFELGAEPGNTGALLLGQGAERALTIMLAPAQAIVRLRESEGEVVELECGAEPFEADRPAVLEVGEEGHRVRVLQAERVVVDCSLAALDPWPDSGGLHVGFGVAGPGDRTFRSLRLARL
jgi:hypothetical protein